MSELINNVSRERQERLKSFILRLHQGEDKETVEAEFKKEFAYVTGAEIAQMEYNLVQEGVSVEEIQSLCDVHASLFQGSIQDLHSDVLTVNPLSLLEEENQSFHEACERLRALLDKDIPHLDAYKYAIASTIQAFNFLDEHYAKKENILFPHLERSGDVVISQVMWGVDNTIRKALKKALLSLEESKNQDEIKADFKEAVQLIDDMVTKENNVLFPMLKEKLSEDQFRDIASQLTNEDAGVYQTTSNELVDFDGKTIPMSLGSLSAVEANAIFNTIPFDMTFVGADNTVKFVTQGKERIFDRPASVIGRPVNLCHPPQSVDIVMKIVEDLRSGRKDHEDFWIQFKENFVYIRYYAVRDAKGEFLGTLEVTQNLNEIRQLKGEKRLASQA